MNEKYNMDCLPSVYYNEGKLFFYDIATNLKEMWESNETIDFSLVESICMQMKIMEVMNLTFYAISMEDIYLLHYEKPIFVIINTHVVSFTNNAFTLRIPPVFKKEYLHFPGLMIKRLPLTCHKNSIYYTIGLIVYTFFFKTYPTWKGGYYGNDRVEEDIEKRKGTKIYYFLKRCFHGELFLI
jgi:hypothetical protein